MVLVFPYLMAMNYFHNSTSARKITSQDARFNLAFGRLALSCSKSQVELLLDMLQSMEPYMLPTYDSTHDRERNLYRIIVPAETATFRQLYTYGPYSLRNILPSPVLKVVGGSGANGHSYASMMDCVADFLAFGCGVDDFHDKSSGIPSFFSGTSTQLRDSRTAFEIKANALRILTSASPTSTPPTSTSSTSTSTTSTSPMSTSSTVRKFIISAFCTLSDDFDPTVSIVTANKYGIWMNQISFLRGFDAVNEFSNTYVISLGPKGADHEPVLTTIEKELNSLRNGSAPLMYHGGLQEMVQPVFAPIVRHGDQPERRALNGLKLGKGTNHARWRHSLAFKEVGKFLPSCDACNARLVCLFTETGDHGNEFDTSCMNCTNWSFDAMNTLLHSTPPGEFPAEEVPETGKLPPLVLQYNILLSVAKKTFNNVKAGRWSTKQADAYLSYHCLKSDLAENIINHAMNCNLLSFLEQSDDPQDEEALSAIRVEKELKPNLYEIPKLPTFWLGTDPLNQFHDTPMHLFSGVVKAVTSLAVKALKLKGTFSSLLSLVKKEGQFEYIDSLNLSWFPLQKYTGDKFAGFGSESWIALGRYVKVHCRDLKQLKDPPPLVFPNVPQSKWTMAFNKEWLSRRDLDTTGKAAELSKRVAEYMSDPNCPPPTMVRSIRTGLIIRILGSTHNVLSHLMAAEYNYTHITKTHNSILRLLNDVEMVDSILRKKTDNAIWHQKYNLICLLNMKEDMHRYGPARGRWEGHYFGEKPFAQ